MKDRFLSKVEKVESGCWIWKGKVNKHNGYGYAWRIGGGEQLAHRRSYELHVGPIPEGLYVLHKCDVTKCVNPDHLYVGTQTENMLDASIRGRISRGVKHHTKLRPEAVPKGEAQWKHIVTEADVRFIRASTLGQKTLCKMFGLSQPAISNIITRKNWKHVT